MISFKKLFGTTPEVETARALYTATIIAGRQPHFYLELEVPDTAEGRFEMLAICAFLVLHRLKNIEGAKDLSQAYFDVMFDDVDANLRELGVGDLSVGKKIKKLAQSFYGRIRAFETGLGNADDTELCETLARTLYRDMEPSRQSLKRIAAYMRDEVENLEQQDDEAMLAGVITFLSPSNTGNENGQGT